MSKPKEEKSQEWVNSVYPCCDTSHKQGVKCPIHEKNKTSKVDEILSLLCAMGQIECQKGDRKKSIEQAKTSLRKMIEGLKLGCICARKECICEAKKHNEVIDKVLNLFK
jgi:hypothetical protein